MACLAFAEPEPIAKVSLTDRTVLAQTIRRLEPKIRRRVLELLEWAATRKSTAEIELLILNGMPGQVLDEPALKRAAKSIAAETGVAYAAAARATMGVIAVALRVPATVDVGTARAVGHMDAMRSRILRDLLVEQRQVVQEVLTEGLRGGLNPRQTARLFREAVTLAPNQVKYVASYRRALENRDYGNALGRALRDLRFDPTIRRAAREGKALSQAEVNRMVGRYRERALKLRAETIARTETLRAVHLGAQEAWQQAIDAGDVDPTELERTWIQTPGPRTRDSHRAMRGQKRPIGAPFLSGNGNALMYPHDPNAPASETINCRCSVVTRVVPVEAQAAAAAAAQAAAALAA